MAENLSIKIKALLQQRDDAFQKVAKLEEEICRLLGVETFPFPAPGCVIPSAVQTKKQTSAPKIPSLTPDENAYHIEYRHNGVHNESFQTDTKFLNHLLTLQADDFVIEKIETVHFVSLTEWTPHKVLYLET